MNERNARRGEAWLPVALALLGLFFLTYACDSDETEPIECTGPVENCCDEVRGKVTCSDLSEEDCRANRYCFPVFGVEFEGEPVQECLEREAEFVACHSHCSAIFNYTETCAYHPERPEICYCLGFDAVIPEGWTEVPECEEIPRGVCGT